MEKIGVSDILFRRDPNNLNAGTERGKGVIKKSIEENGWGRPTFAAADGTIIGGNHAMQVAEELSLPEPIVVHSDGTRPIIHVRDDIPNSEDPKAKKLAILDNRASQLNYAPSIAGIREVIESYQIVPADIGFTAEELVVVPADSSAGSGVGNDGSGGSVGESYQVICDCLNEHEQRNIYDRLTEMGLKPRLLCL